MATWRRVKTGYAISTDGKSASINYWTGRIRYDTPKGWIDLASNDMRDDRGIVCRVWLPIPEQSRWRRIAGKIGDPITQEDIAQIRIDIEAMFVAVEGRCSFLDAAYVY